MEKIVKPNTYPSWQIKAIVDDDSLVNSPSDILLGSCKKILLNVRSTYFFNSLLYFWYNILIIYH